MHVAARQASDWGHIARSHNAEFVDNLIGKRFRTLSVDEDAVALAVTSQHHIVNNAHVADKTHIQAVFRNEGELDAEFLDFSRSLLVEVDDFVFVVKNLLRVDEVCDFLCGLAFEIDGSAIRIMEQSHLGFLPYLLQIVVEESDGLVLLGIVENDRAAFNGTKSCDTFKKFLLTVAGDTRDAENFTAVCHEGHSVDCLDAVLVEHTEAVNDKTRFGIYGEFSVNVKVNLFADHHFGERRFTRLARLHRADILALAKNCNAVGDFHNLVELVSDDDD